MSFSGDRYNPVLGRPLQPNSAGGPPAIPQALNRYTATPLGQPGVAPAAVSGGNILPFAVGTLGTGTTQIYGESIARAITPRRFGRGIIGAEGFARIELSARLGTATNPKFLRLVESLSGGKPVALKLSRPNRIGFDVPIQVDGRRSLSALLSSEAKRVGQIFDDFLGDSGVVTGVFAHSRANRFGRVRIGIDGLDDVTLVKGAIGPLVDVGIGAVFQYLDDKGNPLLTPTQKGFRAGVSGTGGALFSIGTFYFLGAAGCTATPYCGIAAGVIGTIGWLTVGQPITFNVIFPGLSPADRNLQPLQVP